MLYWFQVYSKVIQLHIYTYSFFFKILFPYLSQNIKYGRWILNPWTTREVQKFDFKSQLKRHFIYLYIYIINLKQKFQETIFTFI